MLLPLSWLKKFVDIKKTPEQIGQALSLSGSEVEKILNSARGLKKIVIGKIKDIKPHPQADKLQLAYIDVGKKDILEIVCGATNIKPGQKVPVVLLGGEVRGLKIEKRKIRGIASNGMLASERELGFGDDHSGIYILPEDAKVGMDLVDYLELDDPVFELDITPNRPDCFSIYGLAREVATVFNLKLKTEKIKFSEISKKTSSAVKVDIKDKKLCPKFSARFIKGVKVGQSPIWLQNKLRQVGIRSINNIVDITNYIMIETGKPLHVFDADKIEKNKIIIRNAKKNEKLIALDELNYNLDESDLVIADSKKVLSIAGVMGGLESGVGRGTANIIIESAIFDPVSVRQTSKKLNLRSESSTRFEKGIDWETIDDSLDKAAYYMQKLGGGEIYKGIASDHGKPPKRAKIKLELNEVKRLLGVELPAKKVESILRNLGFETKTSSSAIDALTPSWRIHDIFEQADLVEEIGRIIDYNTLPKTLPNSSVALQEGAPHIRAGRMLRQKAISAGYSEILTYSYYGKNLVSLSGVSPKEHVILTNPVNEEYPYLRASLAPWMIDKLSQNSSLLPREEFRLFEIGKTFSQKNEKHQAVFGVIKTKDTDENIYRELRGLLESFVGEVVDIKKEKNSYDCFMGKSKIAFILIKSKKELSGFRLRSSVGLLLVDIEKIEIKNDRFTYKPLPFYPQVERDIAMLVPFSARYGEIEKTISGFNPLLKNYELFDVYHGLDKGSSLAMRLTFYSTDRTLEAGEVDDIVSDLKNKLKQKHKINFR